MITDKIESYLRKIKLENELGGALAPKSQIALDDNLSIG